MNPTVGELAIQMKRQLDLFFGPKSDCQDVFFGMSTVGAASATSSGKMGETISLATAQKNTRLTPPSSAGFLFFCAAIG